jgi:hypothetical protein
MLSSPVEYHNRIIMHNRVSHEYLQTTATPRFIAFRYGKMDSIVGQNFLTIYRNEVPIAALLPIGILKKCLPLLYGAPCVCPCSLGVDLTIQKRRSLLKGPPTCCADAAAQLVANLRMRSSHGPPGRLGAFRSASWCCSTGAAGGVTGRRARTARGGGGKGEFGLRVKG